MKRITKEKQQIIQEILQSTLTESNRLWDNKEQSHAYIVGYLQGTIKHIIEELEG